IREAGKRPSVASRDPGRSAACAGIAAPHCQLQTAATTTATVRTATYSRTRGPPASFGTGAGATGEFRDSLPAVPLSAVALALGAAFLHAGWNVALAGARDTRSSAAGLLLWGVALLALPAALTGGG